MRLLLVEDDPELGAMLRRGLAEDGYAVDLATDGEEGLWRATTIEYEVAILDVALPKLSGFELLRRMRERGKRTPVLFLTARDETCDRVRGLDMGGDDYLVKPFAWDELLARLRAVVRRGARGSDGTLRHGDLELDPARHETRLRGRPVGLTAKEFQVLRRLMAEPGRVLSRTEIAESIYDDDHEGGSNTVEVFLSRLRRKLERPSGRRLIRTVRGAGYALGDPDG